MAVDEAPLGLDPSPLDPTVTTASIAALELMVNTALRYDPGTRSALAKLDGQVLAVECIAPSFSLYIAPGIDELRLMGAFDGEVTTRLRGTLPALLQLAATDTTSLANTGVEVLGSTALLSNLQRISANLDIDWEEALTQLLGDVVGHQLAEHMRSRFNWLGQRLVSGQRLLSEYLTEELKTLPAGPELEAFSRQVDDLRMGVDRAAARVERLLPKKQEQKQEQKQDQQQEQQQEQPQNNAPDRGRPQD